MEDNQHQDTNDVNLMDIDQQQDHSDNHNHDQDASDDHNHDQHDHSADRNQEHRGPWNSSGTQQQQLHRLVVPLILDLLRSRSSGSRSTRESTSLFSPSWNTRSRTSRRGDNISLPGLNDDNDSLSEEDSMLGQFFSPNTHNNNVDDAQRRVDSDESDPSQIDRMEDEPQHDGHLTRRQQHTDQQGQLINSSSRSPSSPSSSRRPRYRLVVYFEDTRDSSSPPSSTPSDSSNEDGVSSEAGNSRQPSRYVAIFSIDGDANDMPIIQSADFQQSNASMDDILNQLFAAYSPKGTPPAKQEIIDALPTATYTSTLASQPKCAVCLEDFEEGAEMVELPCSHRFHGESCVKQWLRMHSSCPVCRYEMPVDDVEYEKKRKERMAERASNPSHQDVDFGC